MRRLMRGRIGMLLGAALLFLAGWGAGCTMGQQATAQKTLMHVFAFTPREDATPQDFAAFQQATVAMVGQIPGLRRVWVGKLREPLPVETRIHTYSVAMEFDDAQALEVYATHPAHDAWVKLYEKVRLPGTATLDILSQ